MKKELIYAFAVVGGGPAGLCAVAKLIELGIPRREILWIDPLFSAGDFGTKLSEGSSVPSNTKVSTFLEVNEAIYTILPDCAPNVIQRQSMGLHALSSTEHCPLSLAAEPMQYISEKLQRSVSGKKGHVLALNEQNGIWLLDVKEGHEVSKYCSKRVILAIGSAPKRMSLPKSASHLTVIDPYIGMIASKLKHYLANTETLTSVAVVGSSHSAALMVMNLLKANIPVTQWMNKPYRFAKTAVTTKGEVFVQYDNTGLKGEVADFIKELLSNSKLWKPNYNPLSDLASIEPLASCSHIMVATGFEITTPLRINGIPIQQIKYNQLTTQLSGYPNLFGLGIAFPQAVEAPSGEIELSVGYAKFWKTVSSSSVQEVWQVA